MNGCWKQAFLLTNSALQHTLVHQQVCKEKVRAEILSLVFGIYINNVVSAFIMQNLLAKKLHREKIPLQSRWGITILLSLFPSHTCTWLISTELFCNRLTLFAFASAPKCLHLDLLSTRPAMLNSLAHADMPVGLALIITDELHKLDKDMCYLLSSQIP